MIPKTTKKEHLPFCRTCLWINGVSQQVPVLMKTPNWKTESCKRESSWYLFQYFFNYYC